MVKSAVDGDVALVSFELPSAVSATSVSVCGEFNGWSPDAQPLVRGEDGSFRAVVELAKGRRWRFRYLIDGQRWENDWAADDYVPNDYGSNDSVVDLTGVGSPDSLPGQPVIGPDGSPEQTPTSSGREQAGPTERKAPRARKSTKTSAASATRAASTTTAASPPTAAASSTPAKGPAKGRKRTAAEPAAEKAGRASATAAGGSGGRRRKTSDGAD